MLEVLILIQIFAQSYSQINSYLVKKYPLRPRKFQVTSYRFFSISVIVVFHSIAHFGGK